VGEALGDFSGDAAFGGVDFFTAGVAVGVAEGLLTCIPFKAADFF